MTIVISANRPAINSCRTSALTRTMSRECWFLFISSSPTQNSFDYVSPLFAVNQTTYLSTYTYTLYTPRCAIKHKTKIRYHRTQLSLSWNLFFFTTQTDVFIFFVPNQNVSFIFSFIGAKKKNSGLRTQTENWIVISKTKKQNNKQISESI